MTSLRGLVDDAGLRVWLHDEYGLDTGHLSRVLRSQRDCDAAEPRLGLLEVVVARARRSAEASGHRARAEELLSAVAGEPVRLGLLKAPPAPGTPPDERGVERRLREVFRVVGELAGEVSDALEDGRLEECERRAVQRAAAELHERASELVQALGAPRGGR